MNVRQSTCSCKIIPARLLDSQRVPVKEFQPDYLLPCHVWSGSSRSNMIQKGRSRYTRLAWSPRNSRWSMERTTMRPLCVSISVLLNVAATRKMHTEHLHMKMVFLYGKILKRGYYLHEWTPRLEKPAHMSSTMEWKRQAQEQGIRKWVRCLQKKDSFQGKADPCYTQGPNIIVSYLLYVDDLSWLLGNCKEIVYHRNQESDWEIATSGNKDKAFTFFPIFSTRNTRL